MYVMKHATMLRRQLKKMATSYEEICGKPVSR
jgi:hypothetical protein